MNGGPIKCGAIYGNGYSGTAEFRPDNDPELVETMPLLSNGTDTTVRIGI
jgi:hypothetical protein